MKNRIFTILLALVVACTSCEHVIDYEGTPEDLAKGSTVINAVAIAGTPFIVYLTHAERADQSQGRRYVDFDTAMYHYNETYTGDYSSNEYLQRTHIPSAQVEVQVNGQTTYPMTFDGKNYNYKTSYTPQEGDHVVVNATVDGVTLTAETTVPAKPQIEVISHEELDGNPYKYMNGLAFETDSIMRLTLCINNVGGEGYYRLRVRSVGVGYFHSGFLDQNGTSTTVWTIHPYYRAQDVFFSDDEMFMDSRLTSGFGGWSAFFSNVFSSEQIQGGGYTFVVDSPKVPYTPSVYDWMKEEGIINDSQLKDFTYIPPQIQVDLEAITEDYYRFLKSSELYRLTTSDINSETIYTHGNAVNGWGILGAMSYDRHIIYFEN